MARKKMETTLSESFKWWTDGEDWNSRLNYLGWDYAHMVSMCEAIAAGDQWKGMQPIPGFDPTFNIIKPSKMYSIATLLSSRVTGTFFAEGMDEAGEDETTAKIMRAIDGLNKHMTLKWDRMNMDYMARDLLNTAADAGDVYTHTYWNPKKDTGQPKIKLSMKDEYGNDTEDYKSEKEMGDYSTELVDGVNVMFGNPNQADPQKQPRIQVSGREMVSILRAEAKANKASTEEINGIVSDENWENQAGDMGKIELQDDGDGKCQYIYTYEKIDGKIYCTKQTRTATIYKKKDTKLSLYPVALLNWETRKNSHRGNPFTLYAIKNQRFVNKMMAMLMAWMIKMSLGKYIIDEDMIQGFSNEIGEVVKVHGSPQNAVMQIQPGNINQVVLQVIDLAIKLTKDSLGANDASMGNIKNPDNASAIIANSQLSAIPLENIKANYMLFLEQQYLIWADFMVGFYTNGRKLTYKDKDGKVRTEEFDAETLREALLNVKIEIGPSSYYSEIAAQTTLDNLLGAERITFIQYLQRIKPGLIPKSDELIDELKAQAEAEQQMMMQQQQNQAMAQQSQPISLEELTADMSEEEIQAMMEDPAKMEELKKMGVV